MQRTATNILDEIYRKLDENLETLRGAGEFLAKKIDELMPKVVETGRGANTVHAYLEDLKANHAARDAVLNIKSMIGSLCPFDRPNPRFIERCVDIAIKNRLENVGNRPVLMAHLKIEVREVMINEGCDPKSVEAWKAIDEDIIGAIMLNKMVAGTYQETVGIHGTKVNFRK